MGRTVAETFPGVLNSFILVSGLRGGCGCGVSGCGEAYGSRVRVHYLVSLSLCRRDSKDDDKKMKGREPEDSKGSARMIRKAN